MKNSITSNTHVNIHVIASVVWEALTKPELIKEYFFGTNTISDFKEGSPIVFKGEWDGKAFEDKGTILIVEPNKIFSFNYWNSRSGLEDKPENYIVITYELFEEGGTTTLSVTQDNIPDEKMKEYTLQSWRKIMNDLKELLEKKALPPEPGNV